MTVHGFIVSHGFTGRCPVLMYNALSGLGADLSIGSIGLSPDADILRPVRGWGIIAAHSPERAEYASVGQRPANGLRINDGAGAQFRNAKKPPDDSVAEGIRMFYLTALTRFKNL